MASDVAPTYACALSNKQILEARDAGDLVICPFEKDNLQTSSYDVTLGHHFYREHSPIFGCGDIYNPYDQVRVHQVWGEPEKAVRHAEWAKSCTLDTRLLTNIGADDYIIIIKPGETILAHTEEFIGGKNQITTMMKARSSMGRNFISVCKCAGWGDVGYINRWTMEITNNSVHYAIPLVVGRRIAQIVFIGTGPILNDDYHVNGKYQDAGNLQALVNKWSPSSMLPKMYMDREVVYSVKDLLEPATPFVAHARHVVPPPIASTSAVASVNHAAKTATPNLQSSASYSRHSDIANPIGALQELLQASRFNIRPTYTLTGHGSHFTYECSLPAPFGYTTEGTADSKKQAKKKAASDMLNRLKQSMAKN